MMPRIDHRRRGFRSGFVPVLLCALLLTSLATPAVRADLPAAYDWRSQVAFPPVRDQGAFDTGWAFACIGELEIAVLRSDPNNAVDLSEQYLINCGSASAAALMLRGPDGIGAPPPNTCNQYGAPLEADVPYQGPQGTCACPYAMAYCASFTGSVGSGAATIKQALLDRGPLAAWVYAGDAFRAYAAGVFDSAEDGSTNHMVMLIGWDDNDSGGVWLVRNSYGTDWGESGYMRIRYGRARIESQVKYLAGGVRTTYRIFGTVYGAAYGCGSPTPLASVPINGLGVTTDTNGQYSRVVGYHTNWCIAPPNGTYFFMENCRHINAVSSDVQADFTGYVSQVSGRVTTGDGLGVPDVTINVAQVNAGSVSTITAADGSYTVTVGWGYTCTATPSKADCSFNPPSRALGAVWYCAANQDFVATCGTSPPSDPNDPNAAASGDTSGDATTADPNTSDANGTQPGDTNGDTTAPADQSAGSQPAGAEETQTAAEPLRCGAGACGAGLVGPWAVAVLSLICLRRRRM